MRQRFPRVACAGCQQLRDGQELFRIMESMGRREGIAHGRMRVALLRLAAMWAVISLSMDAEHSKKEPNIDKAILELADTFALALREAANAAPDIPVSADFSAETRELLSNADARARRHAH